MRYLGLDLGTRTLGISMSDITRTIATSFKTIKFPEAEYDTLIEPLKDIVNETIAFVGEKITIRRFVRYEMGEGIEKPKEDFAAEVSKTISAQ